MKPRITIKRTHQLNGPDLWTADCYINDYTLRTWGISYKEALNKMWGEIDKTLWGDWYLAHSLHELFLCWEKIEEESAKHKLEQRSKAVKMMEKGKPSLKSFREWEKYDFLEYAKPIQDFKWWHIFYTPPV